MFKKKFTPPVWKGVPTSLNEGIPFLFFGLTALAYFLNLGMNNIWTPNESFYAEAVREMLESGNYLDIYYNYEPRFNKPPLLYWLMALSANLFGLSEFSIRFPVALLGLGTIYLVYRIGKLLESKTLGMVAALIMAFSFQFVINARYGSPAVPLTFFFTATLYFFLKGYQDKDYKFIFLAYSFLGLTMLMKGYPYFVIISLIIGVYLLIDSRFNFRALYAKVIFLKPWLGVPFALIIGFSWILYMYNSYGQAFYDVFMEETYHRAFTRKASLKPFFYLEANLWGFLPYSLTFYFGLVAILFNRFRDHLQKPAVLFSLSWFLVMLVAFTIAKGKIPTYFIQAHPAMSIFSAYVLIHILPQITERTRKWMGIQFYLPGGLFVVLGLAMVYAFQGNYLLYLVCFLPLIALLLSNRLNLSWLGSSYFPFYSFLGIYLIFAVLVLPKVENGYRNHHQIGEAIKANVEDQSIPLMIEDYLVHNLPFYAERKIQEYCSISDIYQNFAFGATLALVPAEHAKSYPEGKELWRGIIYYGSETRTLEFILDILNHQRGGKSNFREFVVLYKE